jgi:transcriptional regulator with XRE-family HTH domain
MSFAENLKRYRETFGYGLKEMADFLDAKYSTYVSWENGKEPKYETLIDIAGRIDISVDQLIKDPKMQKDELLDPIVMLFKRAGINYNVKRVGSHIYFEFCIRTKEDADNVTYYRLTKDEFIEFGSIFLNQAASFETVFIKGLTESVFSTLELMIKSNLLHVNQKEMD